MQTSRRQALYNTMDSKPRVICCSFERNRNIITVCLKIQPLVQYTAKPRKERKSAEPKYGWEHWLTWLPIVIRRVGSVNYDCDFSRVDETAATRRTGGTEVVGGPTSQSVLFTFDQIKPHEYKITWKITLQPSIDGTQLIKSRSDSRMIVIYISIGYDELECIRDRGTVPCLSINHPMKVLAPCSVIGAFFVLMFQYPTLKAIFDPGMLMETENSRACQARSIS